MRRADKINARFTLIIGDEELTRQEGTIKEMDSGRQTTVPLVPESIIGEIRTSSP